jgi:hypothetical protein
VSTQTGQTLIRNSVPDPDPNLDPDLPDPHVFEPPGSGSISQRYGSGSFYQQAKIVRKNLGFLLFCNFFWTFYLRKMMSMYLQKVISRKT